MNLFDKVKVMMSRYYYLLLIIALVLAIILRFANLGNPTLNESEAQQALQLLKVVNGESVTIGGQSGYVGLTSFLFLLFGGSDFFARLWPAIFGTLLVFIPFLFRKQMDDVTGIVMAFIIALEPGLVALSRHADGTMITITALAAAAGFLVNKKLIPTGIFLGLSIISSSNFWPLAVVSGLAWTLTSSTADKKTKNLKSDISALIKSRWWILVLSAVITMLLVSSQFLLHVGGISGIGSGLVDYLRSWRQPGERSLSIFLLSMLVTQLPTIVLALWGLIRGIVQKSRVTRFLGLWWGIGLILGILNPSRDAWSMVVVNLPALILTAMQIKNLYEGLFVQSKIVTLIETGATMCLLLFSILNFLNLVNFPPSDAEMVRNRLIGTLLPLALWIAFTMLLAWGWDTVSTKSGFMIGIALLLFTSLVGSGWKAAGLGSHPENEIYTNSATINGEPALLQNVSDISRWNNGQATRIDINLVGLDSSSLLWALRDFDRLTMDSAFPINQSPSIVISGVESLIQSQTLYRGQMVFWSVQPDFSLMRWQDWIKWSFLRVVPQKNENLLLWVRNDLFKDFISQEPQQ